MLPIISVIIPVYNAELYIEKAILSVLNQTFHDFELLIIDDGSTDSSAVIIEKQNDPRIKFLRKQNEGQCKALNFGTKEAKGEFVKFLDADDYLNEYHLEKMMDIIQSQNDLDRNSMLFLCRWQRFSGQNNFWPIHYRAEWCDCLPLDFIQKALGNGPDMLPAWQWLIPTKLLRDTGGWNEELGLGNDFELSIRLILASKQIRFCNDALVYYRSDLKHNMSSDHSQKTVLSVLKSSRMGIEQILSHSSELQIRKACADKLTNWLWTYLPFIKSDLKDEVEIQIRSLGDLEINVELSKKMKSLIWVFGWNRARILIHYYYLFKAFLRSNLK
jgi:glycosyltransferase involved in cell wall biosynthesis